MRPTAALLGALLMLWHPDRIEAHPLHSSFTEVTRDRDGAIVMSIRLFADDFGALVDSLRSLPASRGASHEDVVRLYVERSVALSSPNGRVVRLSWCGMRTGNGLIRVCARSVQPAPTGPLRVRNAMMFDRFADQLSIIRWTASAKARTVVLSANSPAATLD